ncbi:hypothetical protein ColTof4_12426 [Colletotrichum tofieldiae]|nr:hypothetical protein ColTof3_06622 [Colletotrichum tofieldiae]GKT80003.1 hypothetical protein ColTof4_12426 [Colletotrichum tofieldiae]
MYSEELLVALADETRQILIKLILRVLGSRGGGGVSGGFGHVGIHLLGRGGVLDVDGVLLRDTGVLRLGLGGLVNLPLLLQAVVDERRRIVEDAQQHGRAVLLGQHEVERMDALPQRQRHTLAEGGVRAVGLHAKHAATHADVADARADLAHLLPLAVGDAREHLDQEAAERLLRREADDTLLADVALQDRHAFGLDAPAADLGRGGVLLHEHLDTAVDDLDAAALVLDKDVTRESRGVVDGLGGLAGGVAHHEAVLGEARRDVVEGLDVLNDLVLGVEVLEGFLDLAVDVALGLLGLLSLTVSRLVLSRSLNAVRGILLGHLGLGRGLFLTFFLGLGLGGLSSNGDLLRLRLDLLFSLLLELRLRAVFGCGGGSRGGSVRLGRINGDEEAASVLLVGVDSHAALQREVGAHAALQRREHGVDNSARRNAVGAVLGVLIDLGLRAPESTRLVHDLPLAHARSTDETLQLVAAVDNLDLVGTAGTVNGGRDNRLVLDGVHAARGVDDTASDLEHGKGAQEDPDLGNVETQRVARLPILPQVHVLSQRAITRAGHIGEDSVELEVLGLVGGRRVGRELDGGVLGGIVVRDEQVGGSKALELVNKHVAALVIGVVGDQKAGGAASIRRVGLEVGLALLLRLLAEVKAVLLCERAQDLSDSGLLALVDHLEKLAGLAAWRSAHVQHRHAGADVHEERGDHADNFLPADVTHGRLGNEELLESGEGGVFADDVLRGGHPPSKLVGVPGQRLGRLHGASIGVFNLFDLGHVSALQKLLHGQGVAAEKESVRRRE